MIIASATDTFVDFLGFSAKTYKNHNNTNFYESDLCVYMLSATDPIATLTKVATTENFTNLSEESLTAKYVLRY